MAAAAISMTRGYHQDNESNFFEGGTSQTPSRRMLIQSPTLDRDRGAIERFLGARGRTREMVFTAAASFLCRCLPEVDGGRGSTLQLELITGYLGRFMEP